MPKDILGWIITAVLSLLGIAAVVKGTQAGINVYNVYEASSAESQMSSDILSYLKLSGATSASGMSNTAALNAALVPSDLDAGDGSTLKGPWSGSTVTLSSLSSGGFQSTWTGVGAKGCAKFAASQHTSGGVVVNGTTISTTTNDNSLQIASACNAASGNTATITFMYPL